MKKASFLVMLAAVMYAMGGILFKIVQWNAFGIASLRAIIAGTILLVYCLMIKHKFKVNLSVILAAIGMTGTNLGFAVANKLTTAGNTIVLEFTMPVFVILILLIFYKKKPTKTELITSALVLLGIILFFVDSLSAGNIWGDLIALAGGVAYAMYFVFTSREDSDPLTSVVISQLITATVGLPMLIQTPVFQSTPGELWAVAALGVTMAIAQISFSYGIKDTPPVTASLLSGIEPILNPLLVAIFWHEMLTPLALVGAAIVLGSIMVYNVISAKQSQKEKAA